VTKCRRSQYGRGGACGPGRPYPNVISGGVGSGLDPGPVPPWPIGRRDLVSARRISLAVLTAAFAVPNRIAFSGSGSPASCVKAELDDRSYLLREAVLVRPARVTMRARRSSGRTHRDRVTMRARRSRPGKSRVRRRGSASREILRRRHRRTVPCPGGLPAARRGAPQGRFGPGRDDRWRAFSEASIRLTGETRSGTNRNADSTTGETHSGTNRNADSTAGNPQRDEPERRIRGSAIRSRADFGPVESDLATGRGALTRPVGIHLDEDRSRPFPVQTDPLGRAGCGLARSHPSPPKWPK
jgi:hypothetical protein